MKPSRYNFLIDNNGNYVLYNAFSDQLTMLLSDLYELYVENIDNIENLKAKHPQFYDYLVSFGFVVDDDCDEISTVVDRWKDYDENSTDFTLIINPTLKCNMNCWYCYESKKDVVGSMTDAVKRKIMRLISNLLSENSRFRHLCLSFFGGEPLLAFDNVVKDIVEYTRKLCKSSDKSFSIHFTSNGYLLNDRIIDFFSDVDTTFQIALEGNELVHNSVKSTKIGDNAYAVTIANIKKALSRGVNVAVRLNFTSETLPFFQDVICDFEDMSNEMKNLVNFNFQRIWQDNNGKSDYDKIVNDVRLLEDKFRNAGLFIVPFTSNPFERCYADRENTATVNFDGFVFKCTARDFNKENCDGHLCEDGNIEWNDVHKRRLLHVYCNDTCRMCKIFPLCHGGCSQTKLESRCTEGNCLKGYDETMKTKIVYDRIHDILTTNNYYIRRNRAGHQFGVHDNYKQ